MSEEARLAVLETKVDGLYTRYDELNENVVKAIDKIGALVERHDKDIYDTPGLKADIRNLNQAEIDRKKMIALIQAAIIAAVMEPILLGFLWWITYGHKMVGGMERISP